MRLWVCIIFGFIGITPTIGQTMLTAKEDPTAVMEVREEQKDTAKLTYVMTGEVRDASSGKHLQYVNVQIPGKRYATVTNADGGFTIKTTERPRQLLFSHIGYHTQRVNITDRNSGNLQVQLVPSTVVLDEVIVRSGNPEDIFNEAIRKIPDNYSRDPSLYQCFYREVAQKRKNYIYIAEAVTDMYKSSYRPGGIGLDRVSITKGRRLVSPRKSDTLTVKVIGGPVQAVMLDVVKNLDFLLKGNSELCSVLWNLLY